MSSVVEGYVNTSGAVARVLVGIMYKQALDQRGKAPARVKYLSTLYTFFFFLNQIISLAIPKE